MNFFIFFLAVSGARALRWNIKNTPVDGDPISRSERYGRGMTYIANLERQHSHETLWDEATKKVDLSKCGAYEPVSFDVLPPVRKIEEKTQYCGYVTDLKLDAAESGMMMWRAVCALRDHSGFKTGTEYFFGGSLKRGGQPVSGSSFDSKFKTEDTSASKYNVILLTDTKFDDNRICPQGNIPYQFLGIAGVVAPIIEETDDIAQVIETKGAPFDPISVRFTQPEWIVPMLG